MSRTRAGRERRLQQIALQLIVEKVLDRHRQYAQQLRHVGAAERAESSAHAGERRELAESTSSTTSGGGRLVERAEKGRESMQAAR